MDSYKLSTDSEKEENSESLKEFFVVIFAIYSFVLTFVAFYFSIFETARYTNIILLTYIVIAVIVKILIVLCNEEFKRNFSSQRIFFVFFNALGVASVCARSILREQQGKVG